MQKIWDRITVEEPTWNYKTKIVATNKKWELVYIDEPNRTCY